MTRDELSSKIRSCIKINYSLIADGYYDDAVEMIVRMLEANKIFKREDKKQSQ